MSLYPLPRQNAAVTWPTSNWPRADHSVVSNTQFKSSEANSFDLTGTQGVTYAVLLIHKGQLIFERYAHGASAFYLQYSWSMAKSMTHALVGIVCDRDGIDINQPLDLPEWQGDSRRDITLEHLLRMASGLAFVEDYVDGEISDVIQMLNFEGRHDMGAYAAAKPLEHSPGSFWSYSSGTTNIICRWLRERIGGPESMMSFMREMLFEPIGATTIVPKFDTAGTFVGSSYLLATPQDFARFGLLYLRDGMWDGQRILPEGWVDYARKETARDETSAYGAHWWLIPERPNWFHASGYDGQAIIVAPDKDAVLVRCGRSPVEEMDSLKHHLWRMIDLL